MEPRRPLRVLLVEDDRVTALQVEITLTLARYDVIGVAPTAERAMRMAALLTIDLALVDVSLADGSSGIDAAREIYRLHGVRSLFVSAEPARCRAAKGPFALGCLAKPFDETELLIAIVLAERQVRGEPDGDAESRPRHRLPANLELYESV
jgi:two-component system, response regulator PdtaR